MLATWLSSLVLGETGWTITSAVGLHLSENPGIAFGLRLPPFLQSLLIVAGLIIVATLGWRNSSIRVRLACGMVLGGGLANLLDRLRDGLVTDYIKVGSFPVFNIADSWITVGVLLLILDEILRTMDWGAKNRTGRKEGSSA